MFNDVYRNVVARFPGYRQGATGGTAICPCHADIRPSLRFGVGEKGQTLVRCLAGCRTEDVLAAKGLTFRDLYLQQSGRQTVSRPPAAAPAKPTWRSAQPVKRPRYQNSREGLAAMTAKYGRPANVWDYHDWAGNLVGHVLRWNESNGKKKIRPLSLTANGFWSPCGMPTPRPLYRLPWLLSAPRVFLCEGEKACDVAVRLGLVATCWPHGAEGVRHADLVPLARRQIVALPDNDLAGEKCMAEAAKILTTHSPPATVWTVRLPGLPPKGDLVQWIEAHGDSAEPAAMRAELEDLIAAAKGQHSRG